MSVFLPNLDSYYDMECQLPDYLKILQNNEILINETYSHILKILVTIKNKQVVLLQ